ncbi:Os01g0261000, partial [Oryza sativa Japonica Group]
TNYLRTTRSRSTDQSGALSHPPPGPNRQRLPHLRLRLRRRRGAGTGGGGPDLAKAQPPRPHPQRAPPRRRRELRWLGCLGFPESSSGGRGCDAIAREEGRRGERERERVWV